MSEIRKVFPGRVIYIHKITCGRFWPTSLSSILLLLLSPRKNTDALFVLTYWLPFAMYCCAHSCVYMGVFYAHECYVQFNMEVRGRYQLFSTIFIPNSLWNGSLIESGTHYFLVTDWPTNASSLSVYASTVFDSCGHTLLYKWGMGVGIRIQVLMLVSTLTHEPSIFPTPMGILKQNFSMS